MANFIPEQVIDEITMKNDIVDVVSSYVQLKKNGARYTGLCPFHREKTPSFSVSPDKQLFHCFGCGAGGTVIHFIMRAENLDFVDAVKHLAQRANVVIPEGDAGQYSDARHQLRERVLELNRDAAKFYYKQLAQNTLEIGQYLKKRNLTKESVVKFGLGVTPDSADGLYRHLKSLGYTDREIDEAGLILTGGRGTIDKFRDRLMFPIFDVRSNLVGFGGRVLGDGNPKYLNSPQTLVFDKSQNLYAFQIAKNSSAEFFLLAEGYMDVISLHQHGFDSAIASLGTAFTDRQAQLLKKYKPEVIICYDSDEAGVKATLRAIDMLTAQKVAVRVLTQTRTKDPDEYLVRFGAEEFRAELARAVHAVDFKISLLRRRYDTDQMEEKIKFLSGAAQVLKDIDNLVEREVFVKKIAEEYNISVAALSGEVDKLVSQKQEVRRNIVFREEKRQERKQQESDALLHAERQFLSLLVQRPGLFRMVDDGMKSEEFSNDIHGRLFAMIRERCEAKASMDTASVINAFPAEQSAAVAEILDGAQLYDDEVAALQQLEETIRRERIRKRLLNVAKNGGTIEEASELLHDFHQK